MAITYDYYRIFYYVAQCRSFTKAAEVLENNQPNITRCMNNLEYELGCKLLVRSNRGISLTPEGERLYKHVAIAFQEITAGEEEIRREERLESGSISVSVSETALQLLLLDRFSEFHARYPGVRLRITNESSPQAILSLHAGQTDCAVITVPEHVAPPFHVESLLKYHDILLCGTDYRELAEKERSMGDLAPYPMISMGRHTGTYDFYQELFEQYGFSYRVDMEAATRDQVLSMICHNLGIGFYPEPLSEAAIHSGQVLRVLLKEEIPERTISLIEDLSRPQSRAMKAFREILCGKEEKE